MQRLVNRQFAWHSTSDGSLIDPNIFTVTNVESRRYYRQYPDGTGEWMPIDVLLSCIRKGKYRSAGLDLKGLEGIKSEQERRFEKQLDRAENPHKYIG